MFTKLNQFSLFNILLISCRSETIRPLLHTQPAETVFLLQLALCLGPSRYDDLTRRLQGWSPSDSLSNTPTLIDETSVDLELIESALLQSSAAVVDDIAGVESSAEEVELELVPSITSVGHVGEEWYPLFVETCKLIYALYSHGGYGIDESNIGPSIDMSLLYDLIADVILTPLRPLDTKHDESSSMQATCRRHALQLAMLSLDLQTHPDSTCNDSSAVPLILEKLLARDGIKILCGLLDEHFAVSPAASFDTTNSSLSTASIAPVVLLSPILVLLIRVATCSSEGRAELKAIIFPNDWRSEDDEVKEVGSEFFQQKMDPTDVPPGSLRANLINLMTSLDSDLKRYCAELLYTLCDKESGEFVTRTGFGNAIALMQIKGLI